MCCRGAAAALLAHLSLLLGVWSGLALAWCVWLKSQETAAWTELSGAPGEAGGAALLLPLVAAPLALLLAHLAAAGLRGATCRPILLTYGVLSLLAVSLYAAAAAWTVAELARWLQEPATPQFLREHDALRGWLQPLALAVAPELAGEGGAAPALAWAVWAGYALWPLLQLTAALLAFCAAPPRRKRERSSLRRSSSVYYEPSAPAPPRPASRPHPTHAPLDQTAPWY